MPRPPCCRRIEGLPVAEIFGPHGMAPRRSPRVSLTLDEFEAVRLADLEGLHHEQAASRMGVSRATFGRVVESARRKVADAVVHAKVLVIAGGPIELASGARRSCPTCCRRLVPGTACGCPRRAVRGKLT